MKLVYMAETVMFIANTDMPLVTEIFRMATNKEDIKEKGYLTIKTNENETETE